MMSSENLLVKYLDTVDQEYKNSAEELQLMLPTSDVLLLKLSDFKWKDPINDLKLKAPTIFQIFSTTVSHNDHRNASKKGAMHNPSICMAAATLERMKS